MKSTNSFFPLIIIFLTIICGNSAIANNKPKLLNAYIKPHFEYDSESSGGFRIAGTTNLPDGIKMFALISRIESGWNDFVHIYVKDGKISSEVLVGYLTRANKVVSNNYGFKPTKLSSGEYKIHIFITLPSLQPNHIMKVLGKNGELLIGSLAMKPIEFEDVKGIGKTVDYRGSIFLDGAPSREEDNRLGNEQLEKLTTLASEEIYKNKLCNDNYTGAEKFRDISCLNSVAKNVYEKAMEMSQRCKAEGSALSGLCYARYMLESAEKGCYGKNKSANKYTKICLKQLGLEN